MEPIPLSTRERLEISIDFGTDNVVTFLFSSLFLLPKVGDLICSLFFWTQIIVSHVFFDCWLLGFERPNIE